MNFFDAVLQAVNALVQQNLGVFDGMGQNLFRAFATILVAWYGLKAALAAGENRSGFHFANFVTLILMISFGFGMVNYYDTPIPGFGRDFHHLITDEAATLSNQIGQANAQRIADDTNYVLSNIEAPGITQPIATFLYFLLWLGAVVTEALALIIVAFGVVATAFASSSDRCSSPSLSCPNSTGSSGAGSRLSSSIRSTRSWPRVCFISSVSSPTALSTPRLRA